MRISAVGEASRPAWAMRSRSSGEWAMPPPVPPRVKAGRTMRGQAPMAAATARASSREWAVPERGRSRPMASMASLNFWRSSARSMLAALAPMSSTPRRPKAPRR